MDKAGVAGLCREEVALDPCHLTHIPQVVVPQFFWPEECKERECVSPAALN